MHELGMLASTKANLLCARIDPALTYLPMTGRESSLAKEPSCPRNIDDSNTASGTMEPISHLIKLRDDMIAAKDEEV